MNHQNSSVTVFETMDYDRFTMINGNRGLNNNKIKKIIKEIQSGNDMLRYYPIQVKELEGSLNILDGQHRFFIDKKLSRPVYYILIDEDKSMADIARVNSNVEKWQGKNFINCYINQNNHHYRKLQEFIDTYNINIGTSVNLLFKGIAADGSSSPSMQPFESGKFEVKFYDKAIHTAELCKRFSVFPFWNRRNFIMAIMRIEKARLIEMETLIDAFNKNIDKFSSKGSVKEYIYSLEQIINIGKQKRIIIV